MRALSLRSVPSARRLLGIFAALAFFFSTLTFSVGAWANPMSPASSVSSASSQAKADVSVRATPFEEAGTLALAAGAQAETSASNKPPTVLILSSGLRWDDYLPGKYPAVDGLAKKAVLANLVPLRLPGGTCPIDSWLTLSAGMKASARSVATTACPQPWINAGEALPQWSGYVAAAAGLDSKPSLGAFAKELKRQGVTYAGVGTGAAFVLADEDGYAPADFDNAEDSASLLAWKVATAVSTHDLTVVDADLESYIPFSQIHDAAMAGVEGFVPEDVLHSGEHPAGSLLGEPVPQDETGASVPQALIDETLLEKIEDYGQYNTFRVQAILAALPQGTQVILASLAGVHGSARMQMFMASPQIVGGEAAQGAMLAYAPSLRGNGIAQIYDIVPTLYQWLGIDVSALEQRPAGAALETSGTACENLFCVQNLEQRLDDAAQHSYQIRNHRGGFVSKMIWISVGFLLVSFVLLSRRVGCWLGGRPALVAVVTLAGFTISSVPVSNVLINAYPWWRADNPARALVIGTWGIAVLFAVVMWMAERWRPWSGICLQACATAGVILADAATGSRLMADSVLGFNLLAAARFYGLGNEAFAVMATASLLVIMLVAQGIRDSAGKARGWSQARRLKLALVWLALAGGVVCVIDAAPMMGADFGGVLALAPTLLLAALFLARVRITWARVLLAGVVTVAVGAAAAFADWLRPPQVRTHLGRFAQSVLDGDLWAVLGGKLSTNIRLLTSSTYRWVVLVALVLIVLVMVQAWRLPRQENVTSGTKVAVARRGRLRAFCSRVYRRVSRPWAWLAPRTLPEGELRMLRYERTALVVIAVAMVVAFMLNDSGIVLPGIAAIYLMPLVVVAALRTVARCPSSYEEREGEETSAADAEFDISLANSTAGAQERCRQVRSALGSARGAG